MGIYDEAQEILAQPAHIKANLPLSFVAEQYGVRLTSDGQRLSGICPFHPDHDPSMDIFVWGAAERFSCFACGTSGDVLDFVQKMSGVGFREACEICLRGIDRMKALGWERPVLGAVFEWNEEAARDMLLRGSPDGLEEIVAAKNWCFPAAHLVSWGCRSMGDQLLVPVRNEAGSLVGVKHRPLNGSRSLISLPGSRLRTTLYGADRVDVDNILLVEGESDAWTASWLLRDRAICVLSLPAGCGAAPARLDLLTGRRVTLAFDGDDPGRMSMGRWQDALERRAGVVDLPDGHDITSITKAEPTWLAQQLEVN